MTGTQRTTSGISHMLVMPVYNQVSIDEKLSFQIVNIANLKSFKDYF